MTQGYKEFLIDTIDESIDGSGGNPDWMKTRRHDIAYDEIIKLLKYKNPENLSPKTTECIESAIIAFKVLGLDITEIRNRIMRALGDDWENIIISDEVYSNNNGEEQK